MNRYIRGRFLLIEEELIEEVVEEEEAVEETYFLD